MMASLSVSNISDEVVEAIRLYASRMGVSEEAAHCRILEQALMRPEKKSFAEVLKTMPDVGRDSDFERAQP